jgi:DNA repair exonuclease SbcCD nuclease subunit
MRLIHISDLHLGFRHFQRQTPTGINQREADIAQVFRNAIDLIIERVPDIVVVSGDVFHNVRPSNPAILHAFTQFSRLMHALPEAIVVIVAGNHDTPRATETGCILRLFSPLGIHVVDGEERRLSFPERQLSILAVPDQRGTRIAYDPDPAMTWNVLVRHGPVVGYLPPWNEAKVAQAINPQDLNLERWSYVALGDTHVCHQVAPNAFFAGAIDYTGNNIWGELQDERAAKIGGKGFVEFDLETGKYNFRRLESPRKVIDLPVIQARGMSAADLDAAILANVERIPGGIDDKVVRQLARDVPRHIARELDHKQLRELRRRALHFLLDTRRPEVIRMSASGAPGRRPSLRDLVRDKLWSRPLPSDIDRQALVDLGLRYLSDADALEAIAAGVPAAGASPEVE